MGGVLSPALAPALAAVAALPAGARVAVLGSRGACPALLALVAAFVAALPAGVVVVSGGARGVDQLAASLAAARGLGVSVVPAPWAALGRRAGMVRSRVLLGGGVLPGVQGRVPPAALAVVFWSGSPASSPGSAASLGFARAAGVPCFSVVCPGASGSGAVAAPSLW